MGKSSYYRKPYLDSGVFIAWIKGEVVKQKDAQGTEISIDRGKIGESVLTLAESQVYPIIISGLTLAEVHKKKGREALPAEQNQNILDYFEHDFINIVSVDRNIGEEANRLCVLHADKKLSPCDAIHLACAKKAGCDVLLSWDEGLNSINDPAIRIERPTLQEIPEGPLNESAALEQQGVLFEEENAELVNDSQEKDIATAKRRLVRLDESDETDKTA